MRALAIVLLLPLLAACGDTESPAGGAPGAPGAAGPATANDPGTRTLLTRLRERVTAGGGLSDASWNQDVAQLQRLLWPGMATEDAERGTRAHVSLSQVAADVGAWLAKDAERRALSAEPDPVSLDVHKAWLEAASGTPDAYRAWCVGDAAALLKRLEDDRRARLFERPPR